MNNFLEEMMAAVQRTEGLQNCRCIQTDSGGMVPFPVARPIICFALEAADRLDYFLGYDEVLFGSEKLKVSVLCEEKKGGSFCETLAKKVCQALLLADTEKNITSVAVEKCMYDKANFAYKVIMRFSLREHTQRL